MRARDRGEKARIDYKRHSRDVFHISLHTIFAFDRVMECKEVCCAHASISTSRDHDEETWRPHRATSAFPVTQSLSLSLLQRFKGE